MATKTTAKRPAVAVARVLRGLGLRQAGIGRDFCVTGLYRRGERLRTIVVLFTHHAEGVVARNADAIEEACDAEGWNFRVSVENVNGRPVCSIANGGRRVREDVPGVTQEQRPAEPEPEQVRGIGLFGEPTQYQRAHRPVRVLQVRCAGTEREDGLCTACGRAIESKRDHLPNREGSLGYVEHYADGSALLRPPVAG